MEKYDITKPMKIPVGMHKLNGEPGISFQLNRLVNMDGCDLAVAKEIGLAIKSASDFYRVLKSRADSELEQGHIKNAAALYRMSEFYTDWEDENGLNAWKKARELFFQYYADFFSGERPIVKLVKVPYEGCEMPVLKFNAESPKGTIVMHGGFDSSYEEFFSECEYLRERGYDVYLFEGPGQGECIRLYGAPLVIEWEKPVMAVTEYFDLHDVILVGQSLGGFFAPRASAFDDRVTKCVSIAQFGALKMNFSDNAIVNGLTIGLLNVVLYGFGWLINILYAAKKGKGMPFFRTYFHRMGTTNVYRLEDPLEHSPPSDCRQADQGLPDNRRQQGFNGMPRGSGQASADSAESAVSLLPRDNGVRAGCRPLLLRKSDRGDGRSTTVGRNDRAPRQVV